MAVSTAGETTALGPRRLPEGFQAADSATLAVVAIVALLCVPARMILRGLPLSVTPADVVGLALGLFWLFAQSTTTLGAAKGRNPARTGLFLYLAASLAVYGHAAFGYLEKDELNLMDHALVVLVGGIGLGLAVCDGIASRRRLDLVMRGMVVTGVVVSIVGGFQSILEFDLTAYMALPFLQANGVEGITNVLARDDLNRVAATLGHPIEFAVVSAMILPVAVHYAVHARDRGSSPLRWWFCTAMIAMGLVYSVSRTGVIAVATVGVVLMAGWPARRRLRALGVVFGFLVVVQIVMPGVLGTFYRLFAGFGSDDSIRYRVHDYPNALEEFLRHPWLGRGLATWYAPKHQVFDNQYLLTLVESGIVGVLAFLALVGTGVYAAQRARHLTSDPVLRDLALSMTAPLLVPVVCSITFDQLSYPAATGLMFLQAGAAGALLRVVRKENAAAGKSLSPRTPEVRPYS
ncbi:O-antigen ligase family protein [Microbispora sp. NEAU-D428]|uniref:O-antigen ligase family protein n=1 Tax=Microbispora sitophila TaxID=2771537 RepID=UPI0018686F24|nr:O-antigen ligase family protein [Microbispora sitophila]MBE3012341.1 O-antigen ligase family protein [Microbispora sitophila]